MIVQIHVPKSGGTTLRTALERRYRVWRPHGPRGQGDAADGLLGFVRRGDPLPDVDVVAGHIPLGVRDYLPAGTRYITVLRDPVDRALSHYFAEVGPDAWRDGSAPDFAATVAAHRHVLDNLHTRYLCGRLDAFDGPATESMLEAAVENLARIEFGFTEQLGEFLDALGLEPVPPERVSDNKPGRDEVPEALTSAAVKANRLDLELWRSVNEAV